MMGERVICPECKRTFTRIVGNEPLCGICIDPEGYKQFLERLEGVREGDEDE